MARARRNVWRPLLGDPPDAGARQDEVDPGNELLAIVMLAQLRRHPPKKWARFGIILNPALAYGLQPCLTVRSARKRAGVGRVLTGDTEDVVRQRRSAVELCIDRNTKRLEPSADAFEDLSNPGMPWFAEKVSAGPRVRVNDIEYRERDGADRGPWLLLPAHFRQRAGENISRRGGKQVVPVGNMPVERPAARRQVCRQRSKRQGGLPARIENLDRRLDNPRLGKGVCPPRGLMGSLRHAFTMTYLERRSNPCYMEQCSNRSKAPP